MTTPSDDFVESVKSLARQGDVLALDEALAQMDPRRAIEVLAIVQRDLYWTHKEIGVLVTVSRVGIKHLLKLAEKSPDSSEAGDLGHEAKALAYDLASFTWPGWDEPGIDLRPEDVAAGLEAAQLNLRLAVELCRPEKAKANAHWLLGAHQLAAAEYGAAEESFRSGKMHAERSGERLLGIMLDGYLLLTRILSDPENGDARRDFDSAVKCLREDGSDDAREYANQLTTALAALGEI